MGAARFRYESELADVLGHDYGLARQVPEAQLQLARRRCRTLVLRVERGWWDPSASLETAAAQPPTLLVLDGVVSRCVGVSRRESVELLGTEDVLQPAPELDIDPLVPIATRWRVHETARFAVLDGGFDEAAARWPALYGELIRRAVRRPRSLAIRLALAEMPSLKLRLHYLLAHLSDRWGRVGTAGIEIALRLSQQTLADLTCASREAVNRNLAVLVEDGTLTRSPRGHWVLRRLPGAPPDVGVDDAVSVAPV